MKILYMIIKKIEIQNFRSYYGSNEFTLCNGLNLIIGSNGDGKTTLFEALEWLFATDGVVKTSLAFISKKRAAELVPDQSDVVAVSVTYEHNDCVKILEKKFLFTKTSAADIIISNYEFNLIVTNGIERDVKPGRSFEYDLPAELRKYSMFKGETNLDVFQSSNALKQLIDTFSDVKDFDAYFAFMEQATALADTARSRALLSERRNKAEIDRLTDTINELKSSISQKERSLKNYQEQELKFEGLLENIEKSKGAADQLISLNRRIEVLQGKLTQKKALIKEDYTINLLDDMWVLMGFEEIANEYSKIISAVDKERRKLEREYQQQIGANKLLKHADTFVPLPAHVPGPQIMQEMLAEEICKVCGRPAKKDSEAWNFMLAKLEEYKETLRGDDDGDESLYENNFILEMQKRDTILNDNLSEITRLLSKIFERIELNNRLHEEAKTIAANIEQAEDMKMQVLAQTDGLTEDQLTANYENITKWMEGKQNAIRSAELCKADIKQLQGELQYCQERLDNCARGTVAQTYSTTWIILNRISDAFKNAKETNRRQLLTLIEDYANAYLRQLNVNDFTGTIRIFLTGQGSAESVLIDADGTKIENPNTALKTTQYMSILFAISKLSVLRREKGYPLLFDAPTSSFTTSKEADFFNVISHLGSQVIIVTKSFLEDKEVDGEKVQVLDLAKVSTLDGHVYRIQKQTPFDENDLATIQTVITQIKD